MIIYNCIIIDDDIAPLANLKGYVELHPNLNLISSFSDADVALAFISSSEVIDVVFLDVEMPKMSGLELAALARPKFKKLVFTTGHTRYAYEAFQVEADAFLLKPYSFATFAKTIQKLFPEITVVPEIEQLTKVSFYVKEKNKLTKVYMKNIVAFESNSHYVIIHLMGQKITYYGTLSDVKKLLTLQKNFIQVHRSFIVSEKHIESIEANMIRLKNGISINIGRNYKEDFESFIHKKVLLKV